MLFPSATVVAALVVTLAGASPLEARTATSGSAMKLAAGLWAPKKSKPKPRDDDAREEELLKSPSAPAGGGNGTATARQRRRPIKMDESAEESDDDSEEGDDEDEDRPKVTKRHKRVVEEEEADVEEPIALQPSVIPRLVSFEVGPAMIRRSFAYDTATLQGDKGVRLGYQLAVEAYPFVTQMSGAHRTLGIGAYYEKQYGDATATMPDGSFSGYGFNQSRWGFDARYGFPIGQWFLLMPALGYGHMGADLQRNQAVAPGNCMSAGGMPPCFGDVSAPFISADIHMRLGVTPQFALSLVGGYMLGLGVTKGDHQITAEAPATMRGFHVDAGATFLIKDWLAVQAVVPFRRYSFAFDGTGLAYKSAADMYYGVMGGLVVFTK
jgi:hypothetical protein